ncbi:DUF2268 domain-containing putative Zn-dependent protease [Serratia fonticola]|uniref:DUF2268 domain-containing protein n=1 Tax=Serratia fonticola TaxID=47917 RepID=A0AAW3WSS0_SERFO|nr:DUF2268 domain-containing putative Zn-dependent protease [Serratia fonticola]MBC3213775.1 hypothetical protein [Serratia fonticola]NYA14726.1 hypothetical protein [Serratia fonticola]NYA34654.1 hypothetical protein [Serratia fonticola]
MVKLHWLTASGSLESYRQQITDEFDLAIESVGTFCHLPALDVLVQRVVSGTIPELGLSGRAWGPHLFSMFFDPDNPNFINSIKNGALCRQIVHEMHHCLRMGTVGYGSTLGEALVSEGLAGHFVRYVLGTEPELWERAVTTEYLRLLPVTEQLLKMPYYDHAEWFFGTGKYPKWLGYSLGYHLVNIWLYSGSKDTDIRINVEADEVISSFISNGCVI